MYTMLEDITNIMKRPYCDPPLAELLNVTNGKKFTINKTNFVIGRAKTCSLVIHEVYISRQHCVITYENGIFKIYDDNSTTATYINCIEIPRGKSNAQQLNDGDIIGFGELGNMTYIHKFVLCTRTYNSKICKMDENISGIRMTDLYKINSEVKNMKIEYLQLRHSLNTMFNVTLNTMFNNFQKVINENLEAIKKKNTLLKASTEEIRRKSIADTIVERNNLVYKVLENDFLCSICNEIMIKTTTVNCSHSFCEHCIKTWLIKSHVCPNCRTPISNTFHTLIVDSFITNFCDLVGGFLKDQRNNLLKERSAVSFAPRVLPPQTARRGRPRIRNFQPRQPIDNQRFHLLNYRMLEYQRDSVNMYPRTALPEIIHDRHVEVVDLTNQT
ncbi:Hypothetical protein CINCED_3A013386 [Cinara cedri]|uniref:E3 ubiquitin-protein ligase CHFR n=1 Tax=Cinara cedri TaxID=506608 RepID=A0A5E4MPU2_9HEMI|nr:Hypothetical protein CINCED_3A013386 [Cinara cedri]